MIGPARDLCGSATMGGMDDPFDLPPDVLRRVPLFAELSKVLSWSGGPVNWDLARQVAISVAAEDAPAHHVDDRDHAEIAEHVRVAELWLAEIAALPEPTHVVPVRAATPSEWADAAPGCLGELIEPVAAKVAGAMSQRTDALPDGIDASMLTQALGQMAPMFMGIQAGTLLGALAREVFGIHDTGVPVAEDTMLLVVPSVDGFARDYQLDARLARQWVALRAAAHHMAGDGLSFVRTHFLSLFHNYVAALEFDFGDALRRIQELDLSDPSKIQDALGDEALFNHHVSHDTERAAARIASFIAILDAHTEAAAEAAGSRAGQIGAAAEAFRRRAAGRGLRRLTQFIGLDPDGERAPERAFVRAIVAAHGWQVLNRMWEDPMGFPTEAELADPDAWVRRTAG